MSNKPTTTRDAKLLKTPPHLPRLVDIKKPLHTETFGNPLPRKTSVTLLVWNITNSPIFNSSHHAILCLDTVLTGQSLWQKLSLVNSSSVSASISVKKNILMAKVMIFMTSQFLLEVLLVDADYRIYHGGGKMPTIRPNKQRLEAIFMKNSTIEGKVFEQRIRKAVRQTKHVQRRPKARSVHLYPSSKECVCTAD